MRAEVIPFPKKWGIIAILWWRQGDRDTYAIASDLKDHGYDVREAEVYNFVFGHKSENEE